MTLNKRAAYERNIEAARAAMARAAAQENAAAYERARYVLDWATAGLNALPQTAPSALPISVHRKES